MPEVGLWHVAQGRQPTRLLPQALATERDLEDWIANDPSLVAWPACGLPASSPWPHVHGPARRRGTGYLGGVRAEQ